MAYVRENINGFTPQDLNKLNDTLMGLFEKVHGDINFSDTDSVTQSKILTQWMPVQGDGNMDKNVPYYIRFFIPPNVKEVKSSDFNFMLENYRMDSSITTNADTSYPVISTTTGEEPKVYRSTVATLKDNRTTFATNLERKTSHDASAGATSQGVVVAMYDGGGKTSDGGGAVTARVKYWGFPYMTAPTAPGGSSNTTVVQSGTNSKYFYTPGRDDLHSMLINRTVYGASRPMADMFDFQHYHEIGSHDHWVPNHTHTLRSHSHTVTMEAHRHTFEIPGHDHKFDLPPHDHNFEVPAHTHSVSGTVEIKGHSHNLNEGIKVSSTNPVNVWVNVNGHDVVYLDSNNRTKNNIEIHKIVNIGQWNTIKVTTANLGRIVVYGVLELLTK